MKEITKTFKIYEFKELSENAKEKAKFDYLSGSFLAEDLYHILRNNLRELFPNSELDIQFGLSYCAGDGVNIYGNLYLSDMFDLIKDKLSLDEQSVLNNIFTEFIDNIDLPMNHHYTYLKLCRNDIYYEIVSAIEYQDGDVSEIEEKIIDLFSNMSYDYISKWCSDMEDFGYKYLYEISDDDMQEISTVNNWHYLENGELYCD